MVSESESNHLNCFTTSNDDTWLMSHWLAVGHLVRELVRDSVNLFQLFAACCMYQKCALSLNTFNCSPDTTQAEPAGI